MRTRTNHIITYIFSTLPRPRHSVSSNQTSEVAPNRQTTTPRRQSSQIKFNLNMKKSSFVTLLFSFKTKNQCLLHYYLKKYSLTIKMYLTNIYSYNSQIDFFLESAQNIGVFLKFCIISRWR